MKRLTCIALSLLMAMSLGSTKAKSVKPATLTVDYVVSAYVDAIAHGKIKNIADVFTDDLKYSMVRGSVTKVYGKADVLEYFNNLKDVEQDCVVKVSVNDKTPDVVIAKVSMKFPTFTRTNYVTMVNSGKGWRITNVYSDFKESGKR